MCTIDAMATRRDNGAGSVYFDHRSGTTCRDARYHKTCSGRWSASISMGTDGSGKRVRARLTAQTRTELLAKLDDAKRAAESGLKVTGSYTVSQCLDAFLEAGLEGLAPSTVALHTHNVKLLKPLLGAYKLRELTAVQVQDALRTIARAHTTRTVAMTRNVLELSLIHI